MDLKDNDLLTGYVRQFGPPSGGGRGCLERVLKLYAQNDFCADSADYCRFLDDVARDMWLRPGSVRTAIGRYVKKCWKWGFAPEWVQYLGWRGAEPPTPHVAVRLLCEGYLPFMQTYGSFLAERRTYYIHNAIQSAGGAAPKEDA